MSQRDVSATFSRPLETLTVNVTGERDGHGPRINCPATCQASYPKGSR